MTTSYQHLIITQPQAHIALITLNRPDHANALSAALAQEVAHCFGALPHDTRAVIITGAGKHFCAGADLKERKGMTNEQWHAQHHALEMALGALMACPLPVIAAVGGAAFGGGLELALACDFIYAADTARFALTETTLGIIPGMGGTQQLPRAIGTRRAKEILFSGKAFSAQDAHHWGIVNKLCTQATLIDEAIACAQAIANNAPLAIKAAKVAVQQGIDLPLKEALSCELTHYQTLLGSKDRIEGINAFNEKRKPAFTGE